MARELKAPSHVADFEDLARVRRLAGELHAAYPWIDVLANNAGGLFNAATAGDGFDGMIQATTSRASC